MCRNWVQIGLDKIHVQRYWVRVSHHLSSRFTGSLCVKQGCCSSTALFNIYENGLHDLFKDCVCDPVKRECKRTNSLSWTDDLFLVSTTRNGLQTRLGRLTHWGRDKMAGIFQTTFSIAFSWMKMYEYRLRFHWNLFLTFELTIFQHWFR